MAVCMILYTHVRTIYAVQYSTDAKSEDIGTQHTKVLRTWWPTPCSIRAYKSYCTSFVVEVQSTPDIHRLVQGHKVRSEATNQRGVCEQNEPQGPLNGPGHEMVIC
jgi:hypothetical protein